MFRPFNQSDFELMSRVEHKQPQKSLSAKTEALRKSLAEFPEFKLQFFRSRLARRPKMRGRQGLVFGPARWGHQHWYFFDVGGDQNQVQLNVGMFSSHIRVGIGFMIGRQVEPKPPAFQVFQTFLGNRPPLPFRSALLESISKNKLRVEEQGSVWEMTNSDDILQGLETYHVPSNKGTVFLFLGHIWSPEEAPSKGTSDYREAFASIMPFYEELILASGSYFFHIE